MKSSSLKQDQGWSVKRYMRIWITYWGGRYLIVRCWLSIMEISLCQCRKRQVLTSSLRLYIRFGWGAADYLQQNNTFCEKHRCCTPTTRSNFGGKRTSQDKTSLWLISSSWICSISANIALITNWQQLLTSCVIRYFQSRVDFGKTQEWIFCVPFSINSPSTN